MNERKTITLPVDLQTGALLGAPPTPTGADSEWLRSVWFAYVVSSLSSPGRIGQRRASAAVASASLEERLCDALAACKIKTAMVAMHLESGWRERFVAQLESLLAIESWDEDDAPPTEESFATLLRMLLFIRAARRPGLGARREGNFIAAWTVDKDRLTIECLPDDHVRWVVVRDLGGERESAAGHTVLPRLPEVLEPYDRQRWFGEEPQVHQPTRQS